MAAALTLAAALLLCLAAAAAAAPTAAAATTWWRPPGRNPNGSLLRFQYQLSDSGAITFVPGVQVYTIDIDTARTAIPALRKRARQQAGAASNATVRVICYFSAGSWEEFRVDEDRSQRGIKPADWGVRAIGKDMEGWPGEKWVDVRAAGVRKVMRARLADAKAMGCDGVDPDNVNGHENDTGFPLKQADLLAFNKWLAAAAHGLGLGIGLKNGVDMVPQLQPHFDWAINEECFTFNECGAYRAFTAARKPVWGVVYCDATKELGAPTQNPSCFCPRALAAGLNFLYKRADLGAPGISCTEYCKRSKCAGPTATGSCKAPKPNMCSLLPAAPAL